LQKVIFDSGRSHFAEFAIFQFFKPRITAFMGWQQLQFVYTKSTSTIQVGEEPTIRPGDDKRIYRYESRLNKRASTLAIPRTRIGSATTTPGHRRAGKVEGSAARQKSDLRRSGLQTNTAQEKFTEASVGSKANGRNL
jgi:hypothetical protein